VASNLASNLASSSASPNTLTADGPVTTAGEGRGAELVTPVVWSFTLLRVTAILAAISGLLGRVVVPGARGTLQEGTVVLLERASATASYALVGLITALLAAGSFELARIHRMNGLFRGFLIGVMSLSLAIASPALGLHLGPVPEVALSFSVTAVVLTSAGGCLRQPHTRAAAAALLAAGLANMARLTAWLLSQSAVESADMGRYGFARAVATLATIAVIASLGLATVWIGTRGAARGAVPAILALFAAALLTYFALREADAPMPLLAVVRRTLAAAEGAPAPFGIGPLAVLAYPAAITLALAASVQKPHHAAGPLLGLTLASFATFDVPIAALTALTATVWLPLLGQDPRLLWQSLILGKREAKKAKNELRAD
jgi:hypothetical protein